MAVNRLPPGCGLDLDKPILYNPYQAQFHAARRLRKCMVCKSVTTPHLGSLKCPVCYKTHADNTRFPRLYKSLHLRAGRRSGKSLGGAHAVREEIAVPKQKWWVCGPSFKMLHDATMPTLLRLIPPDWVKPGLSGWNQDNFELTLRNDSIVQFRSLDDPERARGQGLNGVWIDEAAFVSERAWQVLGPSLAENAAPVISTTSPGGFDWTYDEFYRRAIDGQWPGYWAAKYRTLDNPLFQQSPVLRREVEQARKTLPPEVFAAEYEGDDVNFTGAVYGGALDGQILDDDDAIRKILPEWPDINPTRQVLVGMDSGADHPFGAVLIVVTEFGLVVVEEYLERMQAAVTHLSAISARFRLSRFANIRWAANKNEAQLRIEFALRNISVIPAENKHQIGIQRVQSWLHTKQLFIVKRTCPKTAEQFRAYRYAENYMADGQKREQEQVFKKKDELPDAVRYAIMAWPELPKVPDTMRSEREQQRWDAYDDKTREDVQRVRDYDRRDQDKHLTVESSLYPVGDFFGGMAESLF